MAGTAGINHNKWLTYIFDLPLFCKFEFRDNMLASSTPNKINKTT